MKPKKAIETLTNHLDHATVINDTDLEAAQRLGIEALKRLDNARLLGMDYPLNLLPGEDKP